MTSIKTSNPTCSQCDCVVGCQADTELCPNVVVPPATAREPGMLQDGNRDLSRWLAGQPNARQEARNATAQPRTEKLLEIIAAAYQIAGAYDAPANILDVLANPSAATQEQIDSMLPFAPAQPIVFALRPLQWSEQREPCEDIRYHHVIAETVVGRISIEWKGWKTDDACAVYMDGNYLAVKDDLEDAKAFVVKHLKSLVLGLIDTCPGAQPVQPAEKLKNEERACSEHPDAPHGFDRDASHSNRRYTCDCEGWESVQSISNLQEAVLDGPANETLQVQSAKPKVQA